MKNFQKKIIVVAMLLAFQAILADDKKKSAFELYKGGWFEIEYPKEFTVKPSLASNMPDKYDSVYFESPDGKVKFYVYSPQWSGEATDISRTASLEIEKDTKVEKKNGITNKWYTYEKKDGTGFRSYQETINEAGPTKHIIGFEYSDREAYKKYRDAYMKFKKSLKQFAD